MSVKRHRTLTVSGSVDTLAPMGRKIDIDLLVGAAEIAERLGAANSHVVHVWRHRHSDFPEPVASLKTALIWYWPDIEAWATRTGRCLSR